MARTHFTHNHNEFHPGNWEDVDDFLAARELLRAAPSRIAWGGVEVVDASWIRPTLPADSWMPRSEFLVELGAK
jgi:hypothetical protein